MKTTSINIVNLCVRCHNHCRYCLLSWDGHCLGIDDQRGENYARRFHHWIKSVHPEMNFIYYFGYSMEHPNLPQAIRFMQETGSPGGEFLQFDGMRIRSRAELYELLECLKASGIKLLDFTFYGTQEYHDQFAGRKGDFALMMDSLEIALEKGLNVEVGIPVTKENLSQIDALMAMLPADQISVYLFTPHSGGRGAALLDAKITTDDYERLSPTVQQHFNRSHNKTPSEWLSSDVQAAEKRVLTLSLLPSNIDRLEQQSFEDTLQELEKMDEDYHRIIPDFRSLLKIYADPGDRHLYSKKDLYMLYRRRYIAEHKLQVMDLTDERFSGSVRY